MICDLKNSGRSIVWIDMICDLKTNMRSIVWIDMICDLKTNMVEALFGLTWYVT